MSHLENLRKKAEEAITVIQQGVVDENTHHINQIDLVTLLHELKVYQVELEMQNEELQSTEKSLGIVKAQFQDLFEFAPVAYLNLDTKGNISTINLTGANLLSNGRMHIVGTPLFKLIDPGYQSIYLNHLRWTLKHRKARRDEMKIKRVDGVTFHALVESNVYIDHSDSIEFIRMVISDIDQIKKMREKEQLSERIIENSLEGILITDKNNKILSVNKTFSKITGYSATEVIGKSPNLLQSGKHSDDFYKRLWMELEKNGVWEGEIWNRRKDGEVYQEWLNISTVKDEFNSTLYYVAKFTDLADCKKAENRLHFLAHFDQLTQLPNRILFTDRLAQSINTAERAGKKVVVFFMDLDGFKEVNDSLGHDYGDKLLQQVASRLQSLVRKIDMISRIGGDEFTLIANEISANEQIVVLANKILDSFILPFYIDEHKIFIGTSIGISIFPDDGIRGSDLVKHADIAMYRAKESGRNQYCFYTQKMGELVEQQMLLSTQLRKAVMNNELVLHYQPQYQLGTGKMIGMEALVRWNHPQRGLLYPLEFIPEAEKSNLIILLGEWVLNTVCKQIEQWQKDKHLAMDHQLRIAVNISPRQFAKSELGKTLNNLMKKCLCNHKWLELEITEQTLLKDLDEMKEKFERIKAMNIDLAIDDFGTGYSSMTYLKKIPIDILKIDRSFIKDIDVDQDDEAIIKAIIQMAHSLGIKVLAEGVETEYQKQFLERLDCDMVQGYYYSKPVTEGEIPAIYLNNMDA